MWLNIPERLNCPCPGGCLLLEHNSGVLPREKIPSWTTPSPVLHSSGSVPKSPVRAVTVVLIFNLDT